MITKKSLSLLTLGAVFSLSAFAAPTATETEIRAVLEKQTASWNKGDTDGFLAGYAADAVFISDTITRGLEKLRVRYQSHYPTRVSMGILTFTDVEVHSIDLTHAFVIGRYHLQRAAEGGGDTGGVFSLLFKKTATGWKIAFDHTT